MIPVEKLEQYVQRLPQPLQAEVLDFVEFLLSKVETGTVQQEETDWRTMSLAAAMRGMEDEDAPTYAHADLKTVFS